MTLTMKRWLERGVDAEEGMVAGSVAYRAAAP
jgi:hypothetical protein